MRMFQNFSKHKEENNVEDSGDGWDSSEVSLDTTGLPLGESNHLFGHDPVCTQDALDAIPGIEDIPELNYWLPRVPYYWITLQTALLAPPWAPPKVCLSFAELLVAPAAGQQLWPTNFIDCYSTATVSSHADLQSWLIYYCTPCNWPI
jgi:hypothetical protein